MLRINTDTLKDYIWIVLFYAAYLVIDMVAYSDLSLKHTTDQLGAATVEGIDIGARVSLFYKAAALFTLCVIAFSLLLNWTYQKLEFYTFELGVVNVTAAGGIFLLMFKVMGASMHAPVQLIFAVHAVLAAAILIRHLFDNRPLSTDRYGWMLSFGIGLYFIGTEILALLGKNNPISLSAFFAAFGILGVLLSSRFSWFMTNRNMRYFRYASMLPAASVVARELSLASGMSGMASYLICVGVVVLVALIYSRGGRYLTIKVAMGWLVFGLALAGGYANTVLARADMFEVANRILPLHQWYNFDRFPILETFNSHVLSEIAFPWLYSLTNGFDGFNILAWDYVEDAMYAVISYMILRRLTNSIALSMFFVLLVPFTEYIVLDYFALSLISVFLFQRLRINNALKNHLFLFGYAFFLLVWRIDLGVANLGAVICIYAILIGYKFIRPHWGKLLLYVILGVGIPIAIVVALFGSAPLVDSWEYVGGAQAYGYTQITLAWHALARMHYFVFPAIILGLGIYLIADFMKYQVERPFTHLLVLFMIFFYLINFQRGLVRHSLLIQNDAFTSSFAFLIFAASAYLFRVRDMRTFFLFSIIASFSFYAFKMPRNMHLSAVWSKTTNTVQHWAIKEPVTQRVEDQNHQYQELKAFMDKNYPAPATFIDFTNAPMLYFYLDREHPGYFNQNLLSIHNTKLQERYLEYLGEYDVPVVIFANEEREWGDAVDGVPNTERHAILARHIKDNYSFHSVIDGKEIYVRK